jgi:hypothetical protein
LPGFSPHVEREKERGKKGAGMIYPAIMNSDASRQAERRRSFAMLRMTFPMLSRLYPKTY